MKRKTNIIVLMLLLTLFATACSTQQNEGGATKNEKKTFGLATASIGGAYYPMGQAISAVVENHVEGVSLTPEVTNGAVENPRLVDGGEAQFGITNSNIGYFAYKGEGPYDKKLQIAAVGNLHPSVFHVIVLDKSSIKSIADLKGKRVAVGPAGGGTLNVLQDVLIQYDMQLSDIVPSYLSYTDGFTQLKDGNVDAALALAGYPAAGVMEISTTEKIRFLELEEEKFNSLLNEFPYYSKIVVPKDVYNLDKDAVAVGIKNILITRPDMDEEVIYNITKAIYENLSELAEINKTAGQIDAATAGETSIPLHPGAEKYFKEKK